MSQQAAAGGHPTTFNTNVNRSKTKKWVEAKSYSYDGDDWGDVDDYDEYGGYDEPAPAPKPTGLRQRGQSANQMPQDPYSTRQDPYQSPVDTRIYGNIGGQPSRQQQQQQYGTRSFTNPQPQPPGMRRMNSFDPEDERRAFSAGGLPQSMRDTALETQPPFSQHNEGHNISAHDFQSGQKHSDHPQGQPSPARPSVPAPRLPSMNETATYGGQSQQQPEIYRKMHPDQPQQSSTGVRTQSMASTNSALDFHNRRDFSPSALPPPLQTRGSPSPHSRSSTTHPPRKSSMGQEAAPAFPVGTQAPQMTGLGDTKSEVSSARDRTASGAGKSLPFVRPADIYRRMQEEKEKERQSQDSVRPSMDTLMGQTNERPDSGTLQDSDAGQRLKPALDPVTERRSEYGLEGLNLDEQTKTEERRPTTSKKFELPKRKSTPSGQDASSLQPMLPDVSRISGFGESFFGSTSSSEETPQQSFLNFSEGKASAPSQEGLSRATRDKDLKTQPSLGFTSAVHVAFDRAEDQVSPTPSSAAGSTVGRSTSGGTSAVSPIISRGPSTSTDNWNSKLPEIEDVTTPTKVDAHESNSSRPLSSSSLSTPDQDTRKSSPTPLPATIPLSTDLSSPPFVPGHRRDLSTPSPDNSPARTPALEVNRHIKQPQEVELAAATPTDPDLMQNHSSNMSEVPEQKPASTQLSGIGSRGRSDLQVDTQAEAKDLFRKADPAGSPVRYPQNYLRTRTDSGSSNRVRDLADKFESGSRPGSAHSATPRSSVFGSNMQKDDPIPPRPLADRMESFRPHLPGGWESSASIAPAAAPRRPEATMNRIQPDSTATLDRPSKDPASLIGQDPSSLSQIKDASEEAFTAVAAAGNALVGAFAAAVGMDDHNEPEASTGKMRSKEHIEESPSPHSGVATRKRNVPMNTVVNPEATKPYLLDPTEDEASTAAPTPLPKDTPLHRTNDSDSPDYFSQSQVQEHPGSASRSEGTAPTHCPSMLPSLSTETGTPQYESDRLRREIVRELSPMNISEPTTAQSDFSNYEDTSRYSTNPGHESGILPREYENYWNDANSDDDTSHLSGEPGQLENATTAHRQHGAAVVGEPLRPRHAEQGIPVSDLGQPGPKPQNVPSGSGSIDELPRDSPRDSPQVLQHRFSWEQPLQSPQPISADRIMIREASNPTVSDVSKFPVSDMAQEAPDAPMSDFLRSAVYPEGQSFEPKDHIEAPKLSILPTAALALGNDDPRLLYQDASFLESQNIPSQHDITGIEEEVPGHRQIVEAVPSSLREIEAEQLESGYNGVTDHAVQQSPTLQSEQMRDVESPTSEPPIPESPVHEPSRTSGAQDDELPPLPPPSVQPKIAAFREILALRSPSDRIRAYDDTREQFAKLNTGLAQWLAITANELPEHADLFADSARRPTFQSHKPSPSRSKLSGLLQSGGLSSQSHSNSPPSVPEGAPGNVSPYGYSPSTGSSGKISSQQVQAKGKDLLHTAGVFGGKANVAAKGLFSKGKSKLRGSSGAEKAFSAPSQSFSPEPRGMQTQSRDIEELPSIRNVGSVTTSSHVQIPKDLPADNDRIAANATFSPRQDTSATIIKVAPELAADESSYQHVIPKGTETRPSSQPSRLLQQSSEQKSPRDAPSVESFTESQEGDDERSEEFAPTIPEPRASSLYLKGITNHRQIWYPQTPAIVPDNSHIGFVREVQTPRSASSSIQTPTQATFTDPSQPAILEASPAILDEASLQQNRNARSSQRSIPQPQSGFSDPVLAKNRWTEEPEAGPRFSHDSVSTYYTAGSGDGNLGTSMPMVQDPPIGLTAVSPYSKGPTNVNLPHQSETSQSKNLQSPTNTQNARPISLIRDPLKPQAPSQDYLWRGPSIDSDPGRVNFDQPPSPLTPRQPTNHGSVPEQRGRTGPVHYGIDHDFDRPSGTERSRSRSSSYFGELKDIRRSQDSRPSVDPNILDHPAFRAVAEGNGMPVQDYPAHFPREETSTPHYALVGGGPTIGRRSESKSRSRRGSRSSAFFKAFTGQSKPDYPPLPNAPDSQASSSPRNSPAVGDRRSKRLSLFRSRSGNMGSGSGDSRSKEKTAPWDASTQVSNTHVAAQVGATTTPRRVEEDTSSKGVSSNWSKKLQRASTSAKPEPESGKKKRFSALGTLFGGRKRQSSTMQSQIPPQRIVQQSHPSDTQQRDPHSVVEPQRLERHDYEPPRQEHIQPPREGYYAPSRQDGRSPRSVPRQNSQSYSKDPDAPAYVQDSALRVHQLMSPVEQPQHAGVPRTSATFPQRSPHNSISSVPRSSTSNQTRTGETVPRGSVDQKQTSSSPWTSFSTHARSKSRQEPARSPSNGALSSPPPELNARAPLSNILATGRRSFHEPARSESPPPPPPPPKDNWHRPRPRDSASLSIPQPNQGSHHSPTPSQSSPRPASTPKHQSLPPLQTNVHYNTSHNNAIGSGRTLTPEEKRKSRQLEIERASIAQSSASTAPPRYVQDQDEEPVMSATSFPGQMWQPSYAHWDE